MNFDAIIERRGTDAVKWDECGREKGAAVEGINAACPRSQLLEGVARLKSWSACSRTSSTTAS